MPDHAHARVVGEDPLDLRCGEVGAVGDADLPGVQRATHADAAAVVERHPGGTRCGVHQRVEDGPVGDRVGAVLHPLRLAVRRRDRAAVEVVAADHDRRLQLTGAHHLVELQPGQVALAVPQPADARRQSLELHALPRHGDPLPEPLVVGEELEDRPVGRGDVGRIARERSPAERPLALAEQRPDVRRDEAGELERPVVAALARLVADRVAVVEDLGPGVLELHHRPHVRGHRSLRVLGEAGRIAVGIVVPVLEGDPDREIRQGVVGRGLVGDDVDRRLQLEQRREQLGGVAEDADRQRPPLVPSPYGARHGVLERVRLLVEVPVLDPPRDARLVDVDADRDPVVHGHRERLGTAHAPEPGGQGDGAGQGAAELLVRHGRERLERALQDPLRADVDPRAGRHLPVHDQTHLVELAELLPVGPVADQVRVRDQHPRGPLMGPHHADRLAGLHEQRLVVLEFAQAGQDRVVRLPRARGLAGAAVHDEVLGSLGDLGVEVVHQHPQRGLGLPRLGGQLGAVGGVDGESFVGRACRDHQLSSPI